MRIFRDFCISLIKIALPFFLMVNLYFLLVEIDPSLDFLGVGTPFSLTTRYIDAYNQCASENKQFVSYFGVQSLLVMFNEVHTDRTINILHSLFKSFLVANFAGPASVPSMAGIGKDWLRDMLKAFYQFFSILLQPIFALAWVVWAIIQLGQELYEVFNTLFNALAGNYNVFRCSTYPSFDEVSQMTRIMLGLHL